VLIIGPNATFLRYISQVLPSLGETDVVMSSLGDLFPGVAATAEDEPEAAMAKGDLQMVRILRAAVRDRQRVPRHELKVEADGVPLRIPADICERARLRARGMRRPHNVARKLFVTEMLDALAREEAAVLGRSLDSDDLPYARERLWEEDPVRGAIDRLWPYLTPQQLVAGLFGDEGALRRAAPRLSAAERALLRRSPAAEWTVADIPLLDEAAELLGPDDSADRALRRVVERRRQEEEDYAQGVLELTGLAGQGLVDAAMIAGRNRDEGPDLTTAERAAADRAWAYGHVIVDEAQELSAMAWRMIMRRVPTRSMTVVGDVAQTGSAAGARSWGEMLDRYVKDRWREERLTVNYRTPAEIMAVAADVLAAVAPDEQPPESVREEGAHPRAVRAGAGAAGPGGPGLDGTAELGATVALVVAEELAGLTAAEEGRLAVIAPAARQAELAAAIPGAVAGDRAEALDAPVALLTVAQAKGLEFDRVVLADPAGIIAQSPQGGHDVYVAITRATHRLTVVHDGDLPPMLAALIPAAAPAPVS
jgi:DNA helicase IV